MAGVERCSYHSNPVPNGSPSFVLAHLSDLHATPPIPHGPAELLNKRILGWLAWSRRRRFEHLGSALEALIADLARQAATHVAITGDLTQVGLPSEMEAAVVWLARIGAPDRVSLVPGNHDAYAPAGAPDPWALWAPYMASHDADGLDVGGGVGDARFPFARRLEGGVAIVGVSSAVPTPPLLATGRVGAAQMARLEAVLRTLGTEGRFRVVLIHHPPVPAGQSRRRQLRDAPALRAVLARAGAELVLHGHAHRTRFAALPGPEGPIPVVGVPSSSSVGPRAERIARYHLYRVEPAPAGAPRRFRVAYVARGYDVAGGGFAELDAGTL
jgi:3',5'-cyclic AMP phosphodiesterase CpdA